MDKIIVLSAIIILPLLPSVIIYKLFGQLNKARSTGKKYGIAFTLGGPIAAYFIIFVTAFYFYQNIPNELEPLSLELQKKESIAKKVIGTWDANCVYILPDGSKMAATSEISITKGEFDIYVNGVYKTGEFKGHWKARKVFLDHKQLSYVFDVPAATPGRSALGLAVLDFVEDSKKEKVTQMIGNFGVIGSNITGQAEFKRLQ